MNKLPKNGAALAQSAPPKCSRKSHTYSHHGIELDDPYHWLRDPDFPEVRDPEILDYLKAENTYFNSVISKHQVVVDKLFAEFKGRISPSDKSVPLKDGKYYYQSQYTNGSQYPKYIRWRMEDHKENKKAVETILDCDDLAQSCTYFSLGSFSLSNDHRYLAYSIDTSGGERFILSIKDLNSENILEERIENVQGDVIWCADNTSFFYLVCNAQWRPHQLKRHVLGTRVENDPITYQESDDAFFLDLGLTSSRRYIILSSADHVTSESYVIPADEPETKPRLVCKRIPGHEYDVDHQGDRFIIRTNDTHKNFRVVSTSHELTSPSNWQEIVPASSKRYIQGLQCFKDWIVLEESLNGIDQICIIDRALNQHYVDFPEHTYAARIDANAEFDIDRVRLSYTSLITPTTIFDYDIKNQYLTTRKIQHIPSGYSSSEYRSQRLLAPARDGTEVPISLVYHSSTPLDGSAPLYLYGYGAYGTAVSPSFNTARLSLLNRGFIYAIAHIRGGDELGYAWYESGKLHSRENTFNDFVDVARYLIDKKFTKKGNIAIAGGSAGGTLMGAATNQAPELWGAVAAHVPFVDVLNTMLDETLPLTPIEWPEWGNPLEDKAAFEHIHSYSPYDQLVAGTFPPMIITAGLNDPRVTYWEPAKYVARLRHLAECSNNIILKTNMEAGHGGSSGRYNAQYELAEEYAFILDHLQTGPERQS